MCKAPGLVPNTAKKEKKKEKKLEEKKVVRTWAALPRTDCY